MKIWFRMFFNMLFQAKFRSNRSRTVEKVLLLDTFYKEFPVQVQVLRFKSHIEKYLNLNLKNATNVTLVPI